MTMRKLCLVTTLTLALSGALHEATADEGRFRVVLCGWKCLRESVDHALEVDGKGDEVWLTIRLQVPGQEKPVVIRTKTMGDVNDKSGRVQAGSRSDKGGIKTGDVFPSEPFAPPAALPITGWTAESQPNLPFVLWEGTLTEGQSALDLEVSIWEDDEGGAKDWNQFLRFLNAPLVQDGLKSVTILERQGDLGVKVQIDASGIGDLMKSVFGCAADRPIGLPKRIVFTHGEAKKLSESPARADLPAGVAPLEFNDSEVKEYSNVGHYQVWVRVQRIK